MICFQNLTKTFRVKGQSQTVIDNLSMVLPTGQSLALLGRNGAGKSTLLKLIAGTMRSTKGRVFSDGSLSWPVGFAGSFHLDLSGAQNIRFIARIYGVDTDDLLEFVKDFAELGKYFDMPVHSYSSGMRARLTFGASMGIRFDTYLVDEVTAVGDAAFKKKSHQVFAQRVEQSSAIMVSHDMVQIRQFCDAGLVLENGHLHFFDDLDAAIALHFELMGQGQPE